MRNCPFCNSSNTKIVGKHATAAYSYHTPHKPKFSVRCSACLARGPIKRTEGEAVTAWNATADTSAMPLFNQESA
ncbi:Lar family restriction alleviation protein [Desulfovibrio psychrotolerans]|uniref:Uncharacterized protein n=1 Tax=Desulfovibrio psychrotolerans TaxID=415242 RepID=A0A7J0BX39_9BACT|nr:Lar family restriction alleviation protein [Desulfovibrio psychrotolerans]GFM38279.1 hypothetical protein DSM19430T_29630 [Desulfovibrio psychrotolerans]